MYKGIHGLDKPTDIPIIKKHERASVLKHFCNEGVKVRQLKRISGVSYGTKEPSA